MSRPCKIIFRKCDTCKKKMRIRPCDDKKFKRRLCSKKCYGTYLRKNPSKRNHFKNGAKAWNKGLAGYHAGKKHYKWRGGKRKHSSGYTEIYDSSKIRTKHGTYRYAHRKVVEDFIGRSLIRGETVHHINAKKKDNRLKNLYVFSTNSDHLRHHGAGNPRLTSNLKDFIS